MGAWYRWEFLHKSTDLQREEFLLGLERDLVLKCEKSWVIATHASVSLFPE